MEAPENRKAALMFKTSSIAAILAAVIAASSADAAPRRGASGEAGQEDGVAELRGDVRPPSERRRWRRSRPEAAAPYYDADPYSGGAPYYPSAGEWSYGQGRTHEAPPPSRRGLHDGLWYY
jgi:hypothetical protein